MRRAILSVLNFALTCGVASGQYQAPTYSLGVNTNLSIGPPPPGLKLVVLPPPSAPSRFGLDYNFPIAAPPPSLGITVLPAFTTSTSVFGLNYQFWSSEPPSAGVTKGIENWHMKKAFTIRDTPIGKVRVFYPSLIPDLAGDSHGFVDLGGDLASWGLSMSACIASIELPPMALLACPKMSLDGWQLAHSFAHTMNSFSPSHTTINSVQAESGFGR